MRGCWGKASCPLFVLRCPLKGQKQKQIPPLRCGMTNKKRCGMTNKKHCGMTNKKRCGMTNKKRCGMTGKGRCGMTNKKRCGMTNKLLRSEERRVGKEGLSR